VVVLLILIYYFSEIITKRLPDYELALVSSRTVSDEFREALENGLEYYLTDLNGDGEVIARVNSYYYGSKEHFEEEKDANRLMGGAVQLAADLELGISMVYITDDFEALKEGAAGGFKEEWLAWKESEVLGTIDLPEKINDRTTAEEFFGNLVIAIREDSKFSESKMKKGYELWELVKTGGDAYETICIGN